VATIALFSRCHSGGVITHLAAFAMQSYCKKEGHTLYIDSHHQEAAHESLSNQRGRITQKQVDASDVVIVSAFDELNKEALDMIKDKPVIYVSPEKTFRDAEGVVKKALGRISKIAVVSACKRGIVLTHLAAFALETYLQGKHTFSIERQVGVSAPHLLEYPILTQKEIDDADVVIISHVNGIRNPERFKDKITYVTRPDIAYNNPAGVVEAALEKLRLAEKNKKEKAHLSD
jgi:fructose-specific phosphotransferase system component IIB